MPKSVSLRTSLRGLLRTGAATWEAVALFSSDECFDGDGRPYGEVCVASRVGLTVDVVRVRVPEGD